MEKSIYKNPDAKEALMDLYDYKLKELEINYEELYLDTFAGKTHVIITGKEDGPAIVLFHGINAGAPLTIEAIKGLRDEYKIYAIDTIGQATKSAETRVSINDDSLARWSVEVLDKLGISICNFIGVSYGAFLLQKLIKYYPERIQKAIFVVPSGFVNGALMPSLIHLSFPLTRFLINKKEKHLIKFMSAFCDPKNEFMRTLQRNTLLGTYMDYRRPPLLIKNDTTNYSAPTFVMVADDDIFFPGLKSLEKCKNIFVNLKEQYILKNCKHMPEASSYPEIENKIREWLNS